MDKLLYLMLLCLSFPAITYSQDCNCESNFEWVKNTFEKNDAVFSYAINTKGKDKYNKHNSLYQAKVQKIIKHDECLQTINEWLLFFRSGHLGVRKLSNDSAQSSNKISEKDIIAKYKDWEKVDIDFNEFKRYIANKKKEDFEGVWISEPYTFGIKKINNSYIGFIIEADGVYWNKGQVKFKINRDRSSIYYMRDHSAEIFETTEALGKNYIQIGFITLERVHPKNKSNPKYSNYFKALSTQKPYFELLDDRNCYLRIPTFAGSEKKVIDSVIFVNKELILKTPNLIIDIRNNGGGSDRSYSEILQFLYTNPIRVVGLEFYSTPTNNQRMLDFANDDKYQFSEKEKKWALDSYDILSAKEGQFVNLDSTNMNMTVYDTIYPYPQNVGILINENNGSTAEQFLLAAKQSQKVKLYGTTTGGVLDISNMHFLPSPCKDFELGYSLSRSKRIPNFPIDDIGIQPDYYLDESISKYDWTEFVKTTISK